MKWNIAEFCSKSKRWLAKAVRTHYSKLHKENVLYTIPAGIFNTSNACLSSSGSWHWNWLICKTSQVENNDFDSSNRHCGAHLHFSTGISPKEWLRLGVPSNYGNLSISTYAIHETHLKLCFQNWNFDNCTLQVCPLIYLAICGFIYFFIYQIFIITLIQSLIWIWLATVRRGKFVLVFLVKGLYENVEVFLF